ncbi:MAG: nucleotide 5'-monophosphate nucleosidase PpnN [Gammaproteobacteria bacterium]|nr:nucleotide 5'-monophosphate nucleosidase PpnN [Gammaproteobacteria bacterium]
MEKKHKIARVSPKGPMETLSQYEVNQLKKSTSADGCYDIFRRCSLAVLNVGSQMDDAKAVLEKYPDFDISVIQQERGVKLEVVNAPESAFVDGEMITGIQEHLFAVLRDIVYVKNEIELRNKFKLETKEGITNAIFHILRNANILKTRRDPNMAVCWGGHSIHRNEYDYTKEVGHELGLRGIDICTGCGPGAMKGPMKGATIGHNKQRIYNGRYLGITEPGIIAAESPNPIVNELVILPDIEKRLEAFVRTGHGIIVFPGGAGTAEEILYFLGILLHPDNYEIPFPFILTGPKSSESYFRQINHFIESTLGFKAQQRFKIIIDDPVLVAREMKTGMHAIKEFRKANGDAFYYNWVLNIDHEFQKPFIPSHENMLQLEIHKNQEPHLLAANLRRAFSGIVSGNVKADGIKSIEEHGNFEIRGDKSIMKPLDALLESFVQQHRMKLPGKKYIPCYKIIT